MKRSMFSIAAALLVTTAIAPVATAQIPPTGSPVELPTAKRRADTSTSLSPSTLASLAEQGYFQSEGIPGGMLLLTEVDTGRVDASRIIQSAIRANLLPAQTANDEAYRNALQTELTTMTLD